MSSIAVQIRNERVRQDRSLADVARVAEVDAAHLLRFERGQREMTSEKIDRVLAALGLKVGPISERNSEHDASSSADSIEDAPTVT